MKKVFSTICGFFPIYPKMSIKFPVLRAPGPVPKMAVTALYAFAEAFFSIIVKCDY